MRNFTVMYNINFIINYYFFILFSRETNESNLLLKEKADSLQGKLQRTEQRITELTRVEIENEVCEPFNVLHDIFLCYQVSRDYWPEVMAGLS